MRFVKDANQRPHKCIFIPQIGGNHELGFIEADAIISNEHGVPLDTPYVSVVALKEIARKLPEAGLCSREDLDAAHAERDALAVENEDLKAQMAEYDKELDAITVLKARGYKPTQKPGPKPKKPAAKAA